MKTIDIFVRTYAKDYAWLVFLWKSILKHGVTGFRRIVVVHPPGQPQSPPPPFPHVIIAEDRIHHTDYYGQMITKLQAHLYSDADEIVFVDSDNVFVAPVDFETYRAPLYVLPWEESGAAICWKRATEEMLGFVSPYETMQGFPVVYPRDFIAEVYNHLGGINRLTSLIDNWIPRWGDHPIIEFDAWGNYAVERCPERFWSMRTDDPQRPPPVVRQFWSHAGVDDPAVRAELGRMGLL